MLLVSSSSRVPLRPFNPFFSISKNCNYSFCYLHLRPYRKLLAHPSLRTLFELGIETPLRDFFLLSEIERLFPVSRICYQNAKLFRYWNFLTIQIFLFPKFWNAFGNWINLKIFFVNFTNAIRKCVIFECFLSDNLDLSSLVEKFFFF